jgi:hypothetical protein
MMLVAMKAMKNTPRVVGANKSGINKGCGEDGLGGLEEKKGRGLDIEVWRWISHDVGG